MDLAPNLRPKIFLRQVWLAASARHIDKKVRELNFVELASFDVEGGPIYGAYYIVPSDVDLAPNRMRALAYTWVCAARILALVEFVEVFVERLHEPSFVLGCRFDVTIPITAHAGYQTQQLVWRDLRAGVQSNLENHIKKLDMAAVYGSAFQTIGPKFAGWPFLRRQMLRDEMQTFPEPFSAGGEFLLVELTHPEPVSIAKNAAEPATS
jgi:hypothetical protein